MPLPSVRPLVLVAALAVAVAGCGGGRGTSSAEGVPPFGSGIAVSALAGPQCPVETSPPDPACAPKPIAFAFVVVDAAGAEVTRGTTGPAGERVSLHLPPGAYEIRAAAGGTPPTLAPTPVTVSDGAVTVVELQVDTGIR